MAQFGVTQVSETLPQLPPNADVPTIVNSLNETIRKLNDTNNQLQELLLNDSFRIEVVLSGTLVIPTVTGISSEGDSVALAHNLGFVPAIIPFLTEVSSGYAYSVGSAVNHIAVVSTSATAVEVISHIDFQFVADDTNVYVSGRRWLEGITTAITAPTETYDFKVYVLRESAQ